MSRQLKPGDTVVLNGYPHGNRMIVDSIEPSSDTDDELYARCTVTPTAGPTDSHRYPLTALELVQGAKRVKNDAEGADEGDED